MLEARALLRGMGLRSEIFVEPDHIHPALWGEVHPAPAWDRVARPGDAAILHYSIASTAFTHVLERCRRSALHYHNITPAALLWRWAPRIALECAIGQLRPPRRGARPPHVAGRRLGRGARVRGPLP